MPARKPNRTANTESAANFRKYPPRPPASPPEVVDPLWIVKALALTTLAALVCGYASLCLLFYQGQWQLLLHPRPASTHPASIAGAPVEFLRFGPDETGLPQRTAWAIPAAAGARYATDTVLFLPPGDGSLAESTPTLGALHDAGLNLFAIDYRGYGESATVHPNQARMTEDAEAALQFLTLSRGLTSGKVILYGRGIGASLAASLAVRHPEVLAVVLDNPAPDPLTTVQADPRTSYLPVRLLLHDRFPLAEPLATLKTPKLLLSPGADPRLAGAAPPRLSVELAEPRSNALYNQALTRFLDQYLANPQGASSQ